jgi:hypothetical protein
VYTGVVEARLLLQDIPSFHMLSLHVQSAPPRRLLHMHPPTPLFHPQLTAISLISTAELFGRGRVSLVYLLGMMNEIL